MADFTRGALGIIFFVLGVIAVSIISIVIIFIIGESGGFERYLQHTHTSEEILETVQCEQISDTCTYTHESDTCVEYDLCPTPTHPHDIDSFFEGSTHNDAVVDIMENASVHNVTGPLLDGPQGPDGEIGNPGPQGPQGPQGGNGTQGINGTQGDQGGPGDDGIIDECDKPFGAVFWGAGENFTDITLLNITIPASGVWMPVSDPLCALLTLRNMTYLGNCTFLLDVDDVYTWSLSISILSNNSMFSPLYIGMCVDGADPTSTRRAPVHGRVIGNTAIQFTENFTAGTELSIKVTSVPGADLISIENLHMTVLGEFGCSLESTGPDGPQGPNGTQGFQGPQGNIGPQGGVGLQGIVGIQGLPGDNADAAGLDSSCTSSDSVVDYGVQTSDLIGLWNFKESTGDTTYPIMGLTDLTTLNITDTSLGLASTWQIPCGIQSTTGDAWVGADGFSIADAIRISRSYTVEMWVSTNDITQNGTLFDIARDIATPACDNNRFFELFQMGNDLVWRRPNSIDGCQDLTVVGVFNTAHTYQQIVITWDVVAATRGHIYINGHEALSTSSGNHDPAFWNTAGVPDFHLFNDNSQSNDLVGIIHKLAIWREAIPQPGVSTLFLRGPCYPRDCNCACSISDT